jgi:hypothetical protein
VYIIIAIVIAVLLIIILPATLVPRPVDCGAISYERGTFVPVAVCHRTGGANAFDNFTITKIGSGQLFISAFGGPMKVFYGFPTDSSSFETSAFQVRRSCLFFFWL